MNPHPPTDWLEFWVRWVCGALFGGLMGLYFLVPTWTELALCCAICGVLAGWFGDRFWGFLKYW